MSCYRGGSGDGAGCQGVLAASFPQLVLWRSSWTACTWRARGQKNVVAVVSSSVHGGKRRICIPPKLDKFPAFATGILTLWTAAESSYLLVLGVSLCSLALDGVQRAPWVAFLSLFPSVSTAVIKKDGLRRTRYAHDLWLCFHYIRCRGHREMNKAVYFFNEYWMGECELAEASSRKKSGAVRDDIRARGSRGRWIFFIFFFSWNSQSNFMRLKLIFYLNSLLIFLGRHSVSAFLKRITVVDLYLVTPEAQIMGLEIAHLESALHKHIWKPSLLSMAGCLALGVDSNSQQAHKSLFAFDGC